MSKKEKIKEVNPEEVLDTKEDEAVLESENLDEPNEDSNVSELNPDDSGEKKDEVTLLKEELSMKGDEAKENFNKFLRVNAEFDNFKKRKEKELSDYYKYANEKILGELVDVVENLERALTSAKDANATIDSLKEGVKITHSHFLNILKNSGLTQMESLHEPFNPAEHDALTQVENDEFDENTIVEVFQNGYYYKDRVLKHAKVVVSKKTIKEEEEEKKE